MKTIVISFSSQVLLKCLFLGIEVKHAVGELVGKRRIVKMYKSPQQA